MTNSSKPNAYSRFIPREELADFAAWTPGSLGGDTPSPNAPRADEPPPPPTAEEIKAQFQAMRQAGYQDGYRDGLVALDGFKQSFAKQMAAQLGSMVTAFDEQFAALEQQMAQAVARTAVELARQVVRGELATRPELVVKVAEEAINAVLHSARHIRVSVHPDDLDFVAQGAADALDARGARLVASEAVARGGCLVESDVGAIDARIDTRWAQAAAALGQTTPLADDEEAAA